MVEDTQDLHMNNVTLNACSAIEGDIEIVLDNWTARTPA